MHLAVVILIQLGLISLGVSYKAEPGPTYKATKGEVWPKPNSQIKYETYFVVRPQLFQFKVNDDTECILLREALIRYSNIINDHYGTIKENLDKEYHEKPWLTDVNYLGNLSSLDISVSEPCNDKEYPRLNMDETYQLDITEKNALLTASTVWGVLRGLETFSQLLYIGDEELSIRINTTSINDYPRFSHRGLLLDTSRHFISVKQILSILDALAYNKFNVFHWHIVDDESFPYVSVRFPELSDQGAFKSSQIYSQDEVRQIIEYARLRGIRVIPEINTPGHTRSWGVARPELLTACGGLLAGEYGTLYPANDYVYEFLQELFEEIQQIFPDEYVHLGGDEVDYDCWKTNKTLWEFMSEQDIPKYPDLQRYFFQKIVDMVDNLGSNYIVAEDSLFNSVSLSSNAIVESSQDDWPNNLLTVISSGQRALLSACWQLDSLNSGGQWVQFYNCEPYDVSDNTTERNLILGGEACMWTQIVNEYNVISTMWPTASATAEKLWSKENITSIKEAASRLEEHTCRMNRRGIEAQPPNGAGFCP